MEEQTNFIAFLLEAYIRYLSVLPVDALINDAVHDTQKWLSGCILQNRLARQTQEQVGTGK